MRYILLLLGALILYGAWKKWGVAGIFGSIASWRAHLPTTLPTNLTKAVLAWFIGLALLTCLLFFVIPVLFPAFAAAYVVKEGPVWMLLFAVVLAAIASAIPYRIVRWIVASFVLVFFTLAVLPALPWEMLGINLPRIKLSGSPELQQEASLWIYALPAILALLLGVGLVGGWMMAAAAGAFVTAVALFAILPFTDGWKGSGGSATSYQSTKDPCDNTYRPYTVPTTNTLIFGVKGCTMEWHVKADGQVILVDEKGRDIREKGKNILLIITKDTPDDLVTPRAVEWRAIGKPALVHAMFHR